MSWKRCYCLFKSYHYLNVGMKSTPTSRHRPPLVGPVDREGACGQLYSGSAPCSLSLFLILPRSRVGQGGAGRAGGGGNSHLTGAVLGWFCSPSAWWELKMVDSHPCGHVHDLWGTAPQGTPEPQPPRHRQSSRAVSQLLPVAVHPTAPHCRVPAPGRTWGWGLRREFPRTWTWRAEVTPPHPPLGVPGAHGTALSYSVLPAPLS